MAPMSKENEVLTISPGLSDASRTPRPDDTAARPQPVALEVPVTVNGARSVEGSDKREPFSETTKTVLVFGNGAVIRLGSPVAPGQLLFLTNEKTKKEVVCQVVKSKNYRSVSGYVELEFTEPVVGFWGMRFPSDRVAAPAPVRPAASPVAAGNTNASVPPAQKPAAPVVSTNPKPLPAPSSPSQIVAPIAATAPSSAATILAPPSAIPLVPATQVAAPDAFSPSIQEPAVLHAAGVSSSLATSLANLLGEEESETLPAPKTAALPAAQQTKQASSATNETEALKQHTARLQEQLSSLLFNSGSNAAAQPPAEKTPPTRPTASIVKQVLEMAKPDAAPVIPALPSTPAPPSVKSSLDTEEVKIPSWLEPLARNAAAPVSTQELVEREKAKHVSQTTARRDDAEPSELLGVSESESAPAADLPTIGNLLPLDEEIFKEDRPSGKSGKGMRLAAIAAGVLIAAGGAWYFLQPGSNSQKPASVASASVLPLRDAAPSLPSASQPSPAANTEPSAQPSTRPADASAAASLPAPSVPERAATPKEIRPATDVNESRSRANSQRKESSAEKSRNSASEIPAAEKEAIRPTPESKAEPAPKKPSLGEVHLASPMMNRGASQQTGNEAAPTLASGADVPQMGDGLNSALGAGGKGADSPAAPLPVGGDVTPAKLISSVAPMYPALAKSQHVSGDVVIDALIDANGRVTTMKVISGPTLLHQAAKDALKQWKYRPATLDGNPVSMHLTVKLQFRMP